MTGGVDGLIVANDVTGEGHITEYPMDKPSVALQIPVSDGKPPAHRVLHEGPCSREQANTSIDQDASHRKHELRAQG